MTVTLVKPIKCRRCRGTGNVEARRVHLGVPGLCFTCDGRGRVEGDKETLRIAKEESERRIARGRAYDLWERTTSTDARNGAWALLRLEPVRFEKLVDSIVAGDPRVEPALIAYLREAEAKLAAGLITV